jgi:hypothetical protein
VHAEQVLHHAILILEDWVEDAEIRQSAYGAVSSAKNKRPTRPGKRLRRVFCRLSYCDFVEYVRSLQCYMEKCLEPPVQGCCAA